MGSPAADSLRGPELARPLAALQRLIEVVAQLRAPGGCPWDQAQTPQTLMPFILEEAYEAVAAIRSNQQADICEELGDLLLQVVLQAQIFSEYGLFDLGDVAEAISQKLIRRHPHVFQPEPGSQLSPTDVEQLWEQTKRTERPSDRLSSKLADYADTLPPLMAAQKIARKVVQVGFEWPNVEGVWAKVAEEQAELRHALAQPTDGIPESEREQIRHEQLSELGDLLFTVVNLGRWYNLDAAEALAFTNQKVVRRFYLMEEQINQDPALQGQQLADLDLATLEQLWQEAKRHRAEEQGHRDSQKE
ncbi:MAG: nucleoside triphosphate pyrophosphohydrolase [Synechococcaceae cyanobacterium SM2_3_2]|nr:nucleoside triphosphate pyrophosphohydrolase [Synechococcaceae cyanobacterium SM2_3_2]